MEELVKSMTGSDTYFDGVIATDEEHLYSFSKYGLCCHYVIQAFYAFLHKVTLNMW
ncbi:unnamed protein product, partial [Ceratitis capitata]